MSSQSSISRQDMLETSSESLLEKKLLFSTKTFLWTLNFTQNPCFPIKTTFIFPVPGSPNSIATFLGKFSVLGLDALSLPTEVAITGVSELQFG
uniref:Uncharacterized protein n=1 Tax=Rhizophora mucronata TaxID=61149 RepID=A0A2P2Q303_RHIMU